MSKVTITQNSNMCKCCEVGCSKMVVINIAGVSSICNTCRKPMCRLCKGSAVKRAGSFGRCDYCCWDEIT